ncbi:hypothetical protein KYT24_004396 [Salmonella enterica]|nr:hypothetical protein [Salmonella enterica]
MFHAFVIASCLAAGIWIHSRAKYYEHQSKVIEKQQEAELARIEIEYSLQSGNCMRQHIKCQQVRGILDRIREHVTHVPGLAEAERSYILALVSTADSVAASVPAPLL